MSNEMGEVINPQKPITPWTRRLRSNARTTGHQPNIGFNSSNLTSSTNDFSQDMGFDVGYESPIVQPSAHASVALGTTMNDGQHACTFPQRSERVKYPM